MITFLQSDFIPEHMFSDLYDKSLQYTDGGTYPWHLYPPMTAEERRTHIRAQYDIVLKARRGVIWAVLLNDLPVMLNGGFIDPKAKLLRWHLGLVGPDASGSRSWLYDPAYTIARNEFWASLNVEGYIMARSSENQSIHKHVESRQSVAELQSEVEVVPTETPGLVDIILRAKKPVA